MIPVTTSNPAPGDTLPPLDPAYLEASAREQAERVAAAYRAHDELARDVRAEAQRRYLNDPAFHARAAIAANLAGGVAIHAACIALVLAERHPATGEKLQ